MFLFFLKLHSQITCQNKFWYNYRLLGWGVHKIMCIDMYWFPPHTHTLTTPNSIKLEPWNWSSLWVEEKVITDYYHLTKKFICLSSNAFNCTLHTIHLLQICMAALPIISDNNENTCRDLLLDIERASKLNTRKIKSYKITEID